jgi:hypothetical protein
MSEGLLNRSGLNIHAMAEAHRTHRDPTPQDLHAEATNDNADVDLPVRGSQRQCIFGIAFGYDAVPLATGYIQIFVDNQRSFNIPVTNGGAGGFNVYRKSAPGGILRIRLTAGGAGVVGHVAILNHWLEA